MALTITRRAIFLSLPISLRWARAQSAPKKPKPVPGGSEFVRLFDPVTENLITRLTNLASNSFLPAVTNRFISAKDRFLVFSSDRTGRNLPFQLNLRNGAINQLEAGEDDVKPQSLCLDAAYHTLTFLDGSTLKETGLNGKRTHVLGENITAFSLGPSLADLLAVRQGNLYLLGNQERTLAEGVAEWCAVRPGGGAGLFGRETSGGEEQELWYVPFGSTPSKAVRLAGGRISNPCWSPDGRSVLFLRESSGNGVIRSEIHEVFPETCAEQLVTPTSQFASFAPNGDGSVFVGASRSKAQPTVVLLLRASRRELTLCEHGAKDARRVAPVFSPDSRRVYFGSDREGKWAIYSVNVESLVEST